MPNMEEVNKLLADAEHVGQRARNVSRLCGEITQKRDLVASYRTIVEKRPSCRIDLRAWGANVAPGISIEQRYESDPGGGMNSCPGMYDIVRILIETEEGKIKALEEQVDGLLREPQPQGGTS